MSVDLNLLQELIQKAKKRGASDADALLVRGDSMSYSLRHGHPEKIERSEDASIGLRVFDGQRQAMASSSDLTPEGLDTLLDRALSMAKYVPVDPYCGLASEDLVFKGIPPCVDSYDSWTPELQDLVSWSKEAEECALDEHGITNSNGADASWGTNELAIVATNGFAQVRKGSGFSMSVCVVAEDSNGLMERDYDYTSAVYKSDLRSPQDIGKKAAHKTLQRLGARRLKSCEAPVIFDPRVGRSLLGILASAINGSAIARGTSFLKDSMGEEIFNPHIIIKDNPLLKRGLSSKPFDGEGLACTPRTFIDHGHLTSWVMDLRSARQLGLQSTGHASRGLSSPPGPSVTNFYLEPHETAPSAEDLIKSIGSGFYVTETIGSGTNLVTGDYSVGASGFWVENGEIMFPVNEVTIASNLKEIFKNMMAANDLEFTSSINVPTIIVPEMVIAGK